MPYLIKSFACSAMSIQAIETGVGYGQWLHGEAVAAGMVITLYFFISWFPHKSIPQCSKSLCDMFRLWLLTCHTALVGSMNHL